MQATNVHLALRVMAGNVVELLGLLRIIQDVVTVRTDQLIFRTLRTSILEYETTAFVFK